MKPVLLVLGLLFMLGVARADAPRHAVVLGVDGLDPGQQCPVYGP